MDPQYLALRRLFRLLRALTAWPHPPYPKPSKAMQRPLDHGLGFKATPGISDGIVPTLSQVHGRLLHVARADHLDVVGHYTLASGRTATSCPGRRLHARCIRGHLGGGCGGDRKTPPNCEPPTSLEPCKVVRKGAPLRVPSESGGSKWEQPISSRPFS